MITENDVRFKKESKYVNEFKEVASNALDKIIKNKSQYTEYDWGMDRVQKKAVINAFDEIILKDNFEVDGRSLRHAHGIGNNSEYDVLDKDLVKVGTFYCNDDMFGGVYTGIKVDGVKVVGHHIR